MKCLADNIIRTHFYKRPGCCDECPFGSLGNCHDRVDMTGFAVFYEIGGVRVLVDSYFCFDGASIPQFAWSIIGHPFTPAFTRAALLHDVIYHSHAVSRRVADAALLELLKADGVSWWKRTVIWAAVRCFGWMYWKQSDDVLEYFKRFIRVDSGKTEECE